MSLAATATVPDAGTTGGEELPTPVLLLKTRSSPDDSYEELFASDKDGYRFSPEFVPVLEHRFERDGMSRLGSLLAEKKIGASQDCEYGGLIFTSQRAVEAFAKLVVDGQAGGDEKWPHLQDVPVYSVGPATTRALSAVPQDVPLQVFGEHTGNGDKLAPFILDHYGEWYRNLQARLPLLFLVGEQRRDIIPKTLMDPSLPPERRIQVDELVVYGTGVMESFRTDFALVLERTKRHKMRWVVVFSPTGCDSMLAGLGLLDESTGKAVVAGPSRTTYIATIGPTTKDYLQRTFDFEPDVCAAKPSPEGVWAAITTFIKNIQ